MTDADPIQPFDGYVRVSRVGGRSGPSYRSPDDQRAIIEQLAQAKGITLGEVVAEEDVSGKKGIDSRELGRLVRKVEEGTSSGIVCWRITRYSRDFIDGVMAAERVRAAGGRIVAEDLDTSMPGSRGYMAMLLDIAENELENRRATWKRATDGAIGRGIHLGATPLGYVRDEDGRLALDTEHPERIEAVKFAFHQRALGVTWGLMQRQIEEQYGLKLARSSTSQIVTCRAYVGEVRHGDAVKANAHPAIVTEADYQAAAARVGGAPTRNGLVAGAGVLHGRVRCSGCGGRMYTNTTSRPGVASYGCTNKRKVRCPAPASILVDKLDSYVLPGILERVDTRWDADAHLEREVAAFQAIASAEAELAAFLEHASVADLGEHYATEVARRRESIRSAIADGVALKEMAREAGMLHVGEGIDVPINPRNPEVWAALPVSKRREIAAMVVEHVTVSKAGQGSFGKQPMEERVQVAWRG
jgi:DNA invertase Pin-like site-specific DNA recombinase